MGINCSVLHEERCKSLMGLYLAGNHSDGKSVGK